MNVIGFINQAIAKGLSDFYSEQKKLDKKNKWEF